MEVEPAFENMILGCEAETEGANCIPGWLNKPDPSTGDCWGTYHSYRGQLKLNLTWPVATGDPDTLTVTLLIGGQTKICPGDTFVKAKDSVNYSGYGPLQVPCLYASQEGGVSSGGGRLTYIDENGDPREVIYTQDPAGNITSMTREDGTDIRGIPWGQAEISFDEGSTWQPFLDWWPPKGAHSKSGTDSTCAFWYRGVFYNFCN
jgi:hypothetical protein